MEAITELKPPHEDYFNQVLQVPPVICGRQLKPLSVGRYRLMARFKCAFAAEEERMATPGDLLLGVIICSMSVKDFMEFAAQPDFKKQLEKWGRKAGFFPPRWLSWPIIGPWLSKLGGEAIAEHDFAILAEEIEKFQAYIQEGSKSPDYWDESPEGRASASHWSQSVEVVLRGELNWSQDEINESPLGQALWDFYKYMENQGLVRLISPEEARQHQKPLTPEEQAEAKATAEKALEFLRQRNGEVAYA